MSDTIESLRICKICGCSGGPLLDAVDEHPLYVDCVEAMRPELARVTRERDEAIRRALGHAYTAQMAEGGESIVQQENDRLHREARETLASFRDLHVAAIEMVRCLMPTVRGEATEQELNATWNALKQLVAVLEKVSS